MLKTSTLLAGALLLCACSSPGPVREGGPPAIIDASSEAAFAASLQAMYGTLDETQRAQLLLAIYVINLTEARRAGRLEAHDKPTYVVRELDIAHRLAGRSFQDIVRMAAEGDAPSASAAQ